MTNKAVWRFGRTVNKIHDALQDCLIIIEKSELVYLDNDSLSKAKIRKFDWDLADTDEFFACLTEKQFADLRPSAPLEESTHYEDVDYLSSRLTRTVWGLEHAAVNQELWFQELRDCKVSVYGFGAMWPKNQSSWAPRDKTRYEDLRGGSRTSPCAPWRLASAYFNDDKPHQVYQAWHADEGTDWTVSRSEIVILIKCMMGRLTLPAFCVHNVPVLLLSIHGFKARIMIAHFNTDTMTLEVKCSPLEQFDGFPAEQKEGDTEGRVRPNDIDTKRDLFFRWINPTCQGDTFLEDSKDAPEYVFQGRGKKRRLVLRESLEQTSSSNSSET